MYHWNSVREIKVPNTASEKQNDGQNIGSESKCGYGNDHVKRT